MVSALPYLVLAALGTALLLSALMRAALRRVVGRVAAIGGLCTIASVLTIPALVYGLTAGHDTYDSHDLRIECLLLAAGLGATIITVCVCAVAAGGPDNRARQAIAPTVGVVAIILIVWWTMHLQINDDHAEHASIESHWGWTLFAAAVAIVAGGALAMVVPQRDVLSSGPPRSALRLRAARIAAGVATVLLIVSVSVISATVYRQAFGWQRNYALLSNLIGVIPNAYVANYSDCLGSYDSPTSVGIDRHVSCFGPFSILYYEHFHRQRPARRGWPKRVPVIPCECCSPLSMKTVASGRTVQWCQIGPTDPRCYDPTFTDLTYVCSSIEILWIDPADTSTFVSELDADERSPTEP